MVLGRFACASTAEITTPSPTIPSIRVWPGPTISGVRTNFEVFSEVRRQPFLRQLDAVAGHAREDDFERCALLYGLHARCLLGRLDGRHLGLGRKVEGNAHDVGILHVEQVAVVQLIGIAAQSTPDDLFAEKLGAESPDAENVGDRVGIPTFGQHRYGNDAADLFPKPILLAYRVHHLAEKFRVRKIPRLARTRTLILLALELLDLQRGHCPKIPVHRFAGLDLAAVDQQRIRAGKAVAVFDRNFGTTSDGHYARRSLRRLHWARCQPEIHS